VNTAQYSDHWNTVHRDLLRTVAVLSDEDLSFQPTQHYSRSVRSILQHIINLEEGWIHFVVRHVLPAWPKEEEILDSVDAIRKKLDEVFAETIAYLSSVNLDDLNRVVQTMVCQN